MRESGFDPDMRMFIGNLCGSNKGDINKVTVSNSFINGTTDQQNNSGRAEAWVGGVAGFSDGVIMNALSLNNNIESMASGCYERQGRNNDGYLKANSSGIVSFSQGENKYFVSLDNVFKYTCDKKSNDMNEVVESAGILIGYEENNTLLYGACCSNDSILIIGNKEKIDYGYESKIEVLNTIKEQWPNEIWNVDLESKLIMII